MEEQLLKPYHQTILDLGDGNAESLQSVIGNFADVSTENGFDIDKLYMLKLSHYPYDITIILILLGDTSNIIRYRVRIDCPVQDLGTIGTPVFASNSAKTFHELS